MFKSGPFSDKSATQQIVLKAAFSQSRTPPPQTPLRFSGRVRKRSLKRLAAMDVETKDKEILFLRDKVYQLEMQVSILLKQITRRQNPAPFPPGMPTISGRSTRRKPCAGACGLFRPWWPLTTSLARSYVWRRWKVPMPDGSSRLWRGPCKA